MVIIGSNVGVLLPEISISIVSMHTYVQVCNEQSRMDVAKSGGVKIRWHARLWVNECDQSTAIILSRIIKLQAINVISISATGLLWYVTSPDDFQIIR